MKRIVSLFSILTLAIVLLCGCAEKQPIDQEKQVAMEIGAQQVSETEYVRYLYDARSNLLGGEEDTAEFWAVKEKDGRTRSDLAMDQAEERWIGVKLFAEEFDRLGLFFDAADEEAFNVTLEQEITAAGGMTAFREQLLANHYTYDEYKTALYDTMKKERVLVHYFGAGGAQEVPVEELKRHYDENYARIKLIAISKLDSYYGTPLEEAELEANREKAKDAYASAQRNADPADFDELISLYSSDKSTRGIGAIYSKTSEDEMAKRAFGLKVGETTLYENESAFFVIRRFDVTDEEVFTDAVQLSLIEEYCAEPIEELVKQWQADAEIKVYSEVTERYRPEKLIPQEEQEEKE